MAFKKTSWNPEDHQIRLGNEMREGLSNRRNAKKYGGSALKETKKEVAKSR